MITINSNNIKILIIITIFFISMAVLLTYKESLVFSCVDDNINVFDLNKNVENIIDTNETNDTNDTNDTNSPTSTTGTNTPNDDIRFLKKFSNKLNPFPSNVSYNLDEMKRPETDERLNRKFLTINELMYEEKKYC
jgi:hypothetical protein